MKAIYTLLVVLGMINVSRAQDTQRYTNLKGQSHVCGVFRPEVLVSDTVFQQWFTENYYAFELSKKKHKWSKKLKDVYVEIYMGTWCSDSKIWVPMFLKLWDEIGLKRDQLKFVALYDLDERYRQGPNGEEQGKDIRRVPTFIFNRGGEEIGRIVEAPAHDLEADLAQIALRIPKK